MKRDRYKRPTKAQLLSVFRDYRGAFPDWSVEHDVVLWRSVGPVKQMIGITGLSIGYRPSSWVCVAGCPDGGHLLFRYPDVRNSAIYMHEHQKKWPQVVRAMEEQFVPPVREPLDPRRVLQLAEEEVEATGGGNSVTFNTLATLSAQLGERDRALRWCDRTMVWFEHLGRALVDWELELKSFCQQLREAVQAGNEVEFLRETTARWPL